MDCTNFDALEAWNADVPSFIFPSMSLKNEVRHV